MRVVVRQQKFSLGLVRLTHGSQKMSGAIVEYGFARPFGAR
jgi:hypothetical protein